MISIMGPPPLDFLQRSEKSKLLGPRRYIYSSSLTWIQLTDYIGTWKSDVPILEIDLSGQESRLQGREKASYLIFLRKMLQWKPEDRKASATSWQMNGYQLISSRVEKLCTSYRTSAGFYAHSATCEVHCHTPPYALLQGKSKRLSKTDHPLLHSICWFTKYTATAFRTAVPRVPMRQTSEQIASTSSQPHLYQQAALYS